MSDINNTLTTTKPMNIRYAKNYYGFSDSNNNMNKYVFELIIKGKNIGIQYFKNIEDNKYSHLIKLKNNIKLSDINSYVATITIITNEEPINYELEGIINQSESSSTQRSHHMYIEFTQNDIGNTLCCCFYTGLDHNKIFASPPL
jgi:hypothetical protein